MKKEIIISAVIVIAIVCINGVAEKYTDKSMSCITEDLKSIREDVFSKNEENAKKGINEAKEKWDKIKGTLVIYLEHDELEKVEQYILETESYIEVKEYNMAIQAIDTCNFIIDHIKDKYEFSLKNIF